ncbi:TetR/AcrR family transcriptional regulator [Primorskyibacter sp. 2E233]|uniref:TetR/AcrR family transcriptional regulator n=1 Tax=Primorskyibacter sp. 2E233 TaxID=3413431 RepID=UPI003BF09042
MEDATLKDQVKRRAILDAACPVFAQYGFRRTSMGDIAQAAGMSRPALYQYYQGKEDIARSTVQVFFEDAAQAVALALSEPGPVADVLARAFRAKGGEFMAMLLTSPHGSELVDVGSTVAADLARDGTERLVAIFAAWLRQEAAAGRVTLLDRPEDLASTMLAALEGAKAGGRTPDYAGYLAHLDRLARLFGAALAV